MVKMLNKELILWNSERILWWPLNPQMTYPVTPDGSLPSGIQNESDPIEALNYVTSSTFFDLKNMPIYISYYIPHL